MVWNRGLVFSNFIFVALFMDLELIWNLFCMLRISNALKFWVPILWTYFFTFSNMRSYHMHVVFLYSRFHIWVIFELKLVFYNSNWYLLHCLWIWNLFCLLWIIYALKFWVLFCELIFSCFQIWDLITCTWFSYIHVFIYEFYLNSN